MEFTESVDEIPQHDDQDYIVPIWDHEFKYPTEPEVSGNQEIAANVNDLDDEDSSAQFDYSKVGLTVKGGTNTSYYAGRAACREFKNLFQS